MLVLLHGKYTEIQIFGYIKNKGKERFFIILEQNEY
jgi:hypothetical protein